MKKTRRTHQVGDQVRAEIARILQREISDPDLGFVTITDVEIAPDFRVAHVFVSPLGDKKKAMAALERAKGKIRHLVARGVNLRYTPELEFRLDTTAEKAIKIEKVLKKVLPKEKDGSDDTDGT
ncbi:MAG TPA: 30S ribosome-binding factor RbfA [Thermoanaerobaculia bacterium]